MRSLVVDEACAAAHRLDLVDHMAASAAERGFSTLCAFTHEPPGSFAWASRSCRMWVRKIAHDCTACALFRHGGQYAVMLPLRSGVSVRPERPAAVIQGSRSIAPRRPNIERLQLSSTRTRETEPAEAVLA